MANDALIGLLIQQLPSILSGLRDAFHRDAPTAPAPTDAELVAAFISAWGSSVAKDDQWLAAHPSNP